MHVKCISYIVKFSTQNEAISPSCQIMISRQFCCLASAIKIQEYGEPNAQIGNKCMKHIPFDINSPLILETKINTRLDCIEEDKYWLRAYVTIKNLSEIPAERPLVLFPQFGLNIRPYPPMTIKPTTSGPRKLLLCASHDGLQIAAHGNLDFCTVNSVYNHKSGKISFTANDYHCIVKDVSNFSILCATGASNFPLRQAQLCFNTTEIKLVIDSFFTQVNKVKTTLQRKYYS